MLKCICEFLKTCNKAYLKLYAERKKHEHMILKRTADLKVEVGTSILPRNTISREILAKLPFPATAFAPKGKELREQEAIQK